MPISTSCPHCERAYALVESRAGEPLICEVCGRKFTVPPPRPSKPVVLPSGRSLTWWWSWPWILGGAAVVVVVAVGCILGGLYLRRGQDDPVEKPLHGPT